MASDIEVLPLEVVLHACVGEIVETLKHAGCQHPLVVDQEPFTDKPIARGVFSAFQIGRQLASFLSKTTCHKRLPKLTWPSAWGKPDNKTGASLPQGSARSISRGRTAA